MAEVKAGTFPADEHSFHASVAPAAPGRAAAAAADDDHAGVMGAPV